MLHLKHTFMYQLISYANGGRPAAAWLRLLLFFSVLTAVPREARAQQQAGELDVIRNKWMRFSDAPDRLYHTLSGEAFRLLEAEAARVAGLKTAGEWTARQRQLRKRMWEVLGPFPEKTPLRPVVKGVIRKDGYHVENIIFESLPGYYVTASLFVPAGLTKPAPAVLFCSGHSQQAFRRDLYQLPLLNLVRKGFIVLAFDPPGQGERWQYYDPQKGSSLIGSSTREHSYPAAQAFLIGQSVARYFVWDGIRSIDYLVSRPEVDARRIGVHGLSGGGTQSAYIGALDERVAAVAPAGYITGHRRLLESIGAQDGEQSFYHGLVQGIDHADLLEMRAPKPALIMATTRDFFSIQGTRETFERVKNAYSILGRPGHISLVEGDYEHGYTRNIRERMYAFFQEHLQLPGSPDEEEVVYLTEQELQKTDTGQLADSGGSETLFSLNRSEAEKLDQRLDSRRKADLAAHLGRAVGQAKVLSGFRAPAGKAIPVFTGRTVRDGYVVEKYFVEGAGDYPVPYVLFRPAQETGKALLYIHPGGKAGAAAHVERLVRRGITVLVPDLVGTGELAPDRNKGSSVIEGTSYSIWFLSVLTGRSIVGMHASDLIRLKEILKTHTGAREICAVAEQEMAPALLHAAAFDRGFGRIALLQPFASYSSVVMSRFYKPSFLNGLVPGSLQAYDLPDLAASLAPRPLLIAGMTDAGGAPAGAGELAALAPVDTMYRQKGGTGNYTLIRTGDPEGLRAELHAFLEK